MLRVIIGLPILLILAVFALSNPGPVRIGLWPTDVSIEVPLSLAILAAAAGAFFLGALVLWASLLGARMRARRAEHAVKLLEAQVERLKSELSPLRQSDSRALATVSR